jgi:hypothetical protein
MGNLLFFLFIDIEAKSSNLGAYYLNELLQQEKDRRDKRYSYNFETTDINYYFDQTYI